MGLGLGLGLGFGLGLGLRVGLGLGLGLGQQLAAELQRVRRAIPRHGEPFSVEARGELDRALEGGAGRAQRERAPVDMCLRQRVVQVQRGQPGQG